MEAIFISDLHGDLIDIEKPFDIMGIGGDVCPVWNHARGYQWEWLNHVFVDWVNALPFKDENSRVVMIAGNHDFVLEGLSEKKKKEWLPKMNGRLVYLDNEEYTFTYVEDGETKELKIFGTPYCKIFGGWAFMRDSSKLEEHFSQIPEGLDILISHDAADIDELGLIKEGHYSGTNAGSPVLAKHVLRAKPKFYFCGHIHSGRHELKEVEGIKTANVSINNEAYFPIYEPLIINI